MYRLSQAAVAFAELDDLPDDQFPAFDKALRNLTQRHFLNPSVRSGRADLYSLPTISVLRLAQKAAHFGLDRAQIEALTRFLQSAPSMPQRWRQLEGRREALWHIEEAIERVREGEDFTCGMAMPANGRATPAMWWKAHGIGSESQAILDAHRQLVPQREADARFVLEASRLIRDLLVKLEA